MLMWLVLCRRCGKYTTVSPSPHSAEFKKTIGCVLCGTMCDANKGKVSGNTMELEEQQPVDLLEVL